MKEMDTICICGSSPIANLLSLEEFDHVMMYTPDYEHQKKISKKNIEIYYQFRFTYYCLKYKKQLRDILWEKIRKPKIEIQFSPMELKKYLENKHDLDSLEDWN
jgi:hypothetical protein